MQQASTQMLQASTLALEEDFLKALLNEISIRTNEIDETIKTIYIGGGTPSLFSVAKLDKILKKIKESFKISSEAEITIEVNPESINKEYIDKLCETGINRISLGIQSLNDSELKYLGRQHNKKNIYKGIELLYSSSINNFSFDLIFGIPGQTTVSLKKQLNEIVKIKPNHLSVYALTVEPNTVLEYQIKKNKKAEPNEYLQEELFYFISKFLQNKGFEHYEISNYAKNKKYSKHNSAYWNGENYLGFGPSAHSLVNGRRFWNINSVNKYIKDLKQDKLSSQFEILSDVDKYNEFIMLSLRTSWGIDIEQFKRKLNIQEQNYFLKQSEELFKNKSLLKNEKKIIINPQKRFLTDGITANLFKV